MAEKTWFRRSVIALGAVLLCALGGLVYLGTDQGWQPTPVAPSPPPPAAAISAPQFDIVRVDPSGNTVIAGHASPGAVVTIKNGGAVVGTATADDSGAFVYIPTAPLAPGPQQFSLSETLLGGQVVEGPTSASIEVPNKPNVAALAVISGPNGSKVVSGQGPAAGTLGLGTVDYDANGKAIFSGTAAAGAKVRLTLGGAPVGGAVAGKDGRWRFAAQVPKTSGMLSLSDGSGKIVTAPFALETLRTALVGGQIIITPGQSLWLIARHVYGHGNMYTLIYIANSGAIHNPNLIFPGQAFVLPKP